jgi:hypothetical protein
MCLRHADIDIYNVYIGSVYYRTSKAELDIPEPIDIINVYIGMS